MNSNYDYIKKYVEDGVGDRETQLLISDFAILWNEYENELYDKEHHIKSIPRMIYRLNIDDEYEKSIENFFYNLKEYISFKSGYAFDKVVDAYHIWIKEPLKDDFGNVQYYKDGKTIYIGEIHEEELKRIMFSEDVKDKLHFMLLIVGRVRNNMFHGIKDISDLKTQKKLFMACNEILKLVLDINRGRNLNGKMW